MIQVKLLKDWKSKKAGEVINISKKGAASFVSAGAAEYLNIKKENENVAKFYRDKHVMDLCPKVDDKQTATILLGVTPSNFNLLQNKKEIEEKEKSEFLFEYFNDKTDYLKIVEEFINLQPVYYDQGQLWWFWNWKDMCWEQKDEIDLMNAIDRHTKFPTVNSTIKHELLEAFRRIGRKNEPQKVKSTWLQFKDMIYDMKTGKSFKASPDYFVTNPIPWKVGEVEDTPMMDNIFEQWVGKEYVQTLYEIIAYCCLCDYPIHRLFCFIGEGLNGKGTFLRLLTKFIGVENCCSTELDVLLNSRFEVTRLYKKLVCQMGETNFNEMKQTSMLKKLTGGDLIGFEFKNKTPFEEINYAKIIIATNNLPATNDKTIGFYRRWFIVDFPNRFSEKEDVLSLIPDSEYENLARKCLFILKDLLDKREFHMEGTIEDRAKKFEDKSNPFDKFIKEFTEEDPNGDIWKFEFEKKFNAWCKENKFREFSEETVGKKMREKGYNTFKKYTDWLVEGEKKQLRTFGGLKWKE